LMLATSNDAVKKQWRDGIRLIREQAMGSSLDEALRRAAANEESPKTDLERFFLLLKQMTVNGYYTSATGIHKDMEYVGNTYLAAFPECTHPEHQG
jgi:Gluconate 2-dehydrogenase subunit 3